MDVEIKEEQKQLRDLNPGDCFEDNGQVCLRTSEWDPDGDIQVVNLHTGVIHRYPPDTMFAPIEAVIKTFREVPKNE